MLTRRGFVSNSSSTSFCIYGVMREVNMPDDADSDDPYCDLEVGLRKIDERFIVEQMPDCDDVCVGIPWSSIKDDETGAQFKQNIKSILSTYLKDDTLSCGTYEEAWFNG